MTIKLTGVVDPKTGLKDFEARYNGDTYLIKRVGTSSKFSLMGCTGTRNDIKQKIVDGYFDNAKEPQELPSQPAGGQWDCVSPAALLLLLVEGKITKDDPEIMRSLDCAGFVAPKLGEPDVESAVQEYELWAKDGWKLPVPAA